MTYFTASPHFTMHLPLDPECPAVVMFDAQADDPISQMCGCWDEITEAFERRHRPTCSRCQEYGTANIEVAGP